MRTYALAELVTLPFEVAREARNKIAHGRSKEVEASLPSLANPPAAPPHIWLLDSPW